ncbi:hypothetical protein ROHU_014407 [Labeo rohita]|uniref:Uncharacterized protein n=1 Tax=Labeo rohita TaxID=84645 RepID=A0A498NTY4_LABRO|nr:hypothetical protein ROHU_014407 [Labeo rohita]
MLEGCGDEPRSAGYDPSEREVIADRIVSEERQPDVSRAIKYSNNGAGLCDPPRRVTRTHINKRYEPINLLGIKKKKKIQPP